MASFAEITIKFGADLKQFSTQMQNAQRQLDAYGKKLSSVGRKMSVAITAPLAGIAGLALNAHSELEGVREGFERLADDELLKNLRDAVKGTVTDLELMQSTVKGANLGLEIRELPTLFEFASRRAKETGENVDYLVESIVTGIGRKSPLILDNLGISAIALKEEMNGVSLAAASVGEVTAAVGAIARRELMAMGDDTLTFKEQWQQIVVIMKNGLGEIGGIIAPMLAPLLSWVKDLAERFRELSPETKKFIVVLSGVAAAVGPLLALAGTVLPAIGTGLTLLTGPIGIVVAALTGIGVVIIKYWDPIKGYLVDIANYFIDLYNESMVFRAVVEGISVYYKNLYEIAKFVLGSIWEYIKTIGRSIESTFVNAGAIIKAALTGNFSEIPRLMNKAMADSVQSAADFVAVFKKDLSSLEGALWGNLNAGIQNVLQRKKYALLGENVDVSSVEEKVSDAVKTGLAKGGGGTPDLTPQTAKVGVSLEAAGITNPLGTMSEQLQDSTKDIKIALNETAEEMTAFQQAADLVGASVGDAFANMTGRFIDSLGLADTGFQGFVKNLVGTITKLIAMLLSQSIANAIAGATSSGAATGPGAVFTTPAFIAAAVGGVLAAFAAIPKFATGGFVGGQSFYGDNMLARVNSGELILNIAQQKNLASALGGGTVVVQPSIRYEGDGFRIMLDRTNQKRYRRT